MKTILLFLVLFLPLKLIAQSNDTLFYDQFDIGGVTFSLNTSALGGAFGTTGYNQWTINSDYVGGGGQTICLGFPFTFNIINTPSQPPLITGGLNTSYMHIVSDAAQASGIDNCNFLAADGICNLNESHFSDMAQDVSTVGYDSVTVSFLWLCAGGTNIYGEVYYSTDSGLSWNLIATPVSQYKNQSNWTTQTISLPVFAQQNSLRFGFRFVNQTSNTANDPGFGIDEFLITGSTASPLVAAFNVSNPGICQAGCVDFFDMSTGNPTSWLWIFQGATPSFSNQQNPTQICYATPGNFDVTLIVGNSTSTDTLTSSSMTVFTNPVTPLVTLMNDTLYTTMGFASYQWFLNGNAIPGAVNYFHPVTTDGGYIVEVTDSNGCNTQSDTLNFTTGIYELESLIGTVTNPVIDELIITSIQQLKKLIIIDVQGKVIQSIDAPKQILKVDVSEWSAGFYFIKATSYDGRSAFQKIIKQ